MTVRIAQLEVHRGAADLDRAEHPFVKAGIRVRKLGGGDSATGL